MLPMLRKLKMRIITPVEKETEHISAPFSLCKWKFLIRNYQKAFVLHLRSPWAQAFKKRETARAEAKNVAQVCQKVHHKPIEKKKKMLERNKGRGEGEVFFFFFPCSEPGMSPWSHQMAVLQTSSQPLDTVSKRERDTGENLQAVICAPKRRQCSDLQPSKGGADFPSKSFRD